MTSAIYEDRMIDADGLATHYLKAGVPGSTIVLVHGGGAGADAQSNWTPVIEHLSRNHLVLALDMVGFGRSAKPHSDDYRYSQAERDRHLTAFLDVVAVGPVTLVGNSMGGLTALGATLARPDLVRALVLMGSAGLPVPPSPQLQAIVGYDYTIEGMQRVVNALTGPDFVAPEGMVAYRHALSVEEDARYAYGRIVAWQRANGGLATDEARIRAVAVPTLVVAGKDDGVVPVSCAYRFLELIPESWGAIIPRCGHWPMIEHPAMFAELVHRFAGSAR